MCQARKLKSASHFDVKELLKQSAGGFSALEPLRPERTRPPRVRRLDGV